MVKQDYSKEYFDMLGQLLEGPMGEKLLGAIGDSLYSGPPIKSMDVPVTTINMKEMSNYTQQDVMDAISKMTESFKPTYSVPFIQPEPYKFEFENSEIEPSGLIMTPVRIPGYISGLGTSHLRTALSKDDLKYI